MAKDTAPQPRAKKTTKKPAADDAPIPYRLTEAAAEPAPPPLRPRTARDLYRESVRRRLGLDPGPEALRMYDWPAGMRPGEMLLWTLGGCCLSDDLFEAILGVCEDLRRIEIPDGAMGEAVEGLTTRLEIIAWIHSGALERMGHIQLEGGAV